MTIKRVSLRAGFFICGVMNNFLYVVMLSASKSLLPSRSYASSVLLADDVPALASQLLSPFLLHLISYQSRVRTIVICSVLALFCASYATSTKDTDGGDSVFAAYAGVCLASVCFGFGESTFFSLLSSHTDVEIGAFSSGTGCAGVMGSGLYLILIEWISPASALLVCAGLMPVHVLAFEKLILPTIRGGKCGETNDTKHTTRSLEDPLIVNEDVEGEKKKSISLVDNIRVMRNNTREVLHYFVPLWSMYVVTYTINHALLPHVDDIRRQSGTSEVLYVSLFLTYQLSVFASRSSLGVARLRSMTAVWVLVGVQFFVLAFIAFVVFDVSDNPVSTAVHEYRLLFPVVSLEGVLSGVAYVNTFAILNDTLDPRAREIVMGIVVCATTAGPICAALLGMRIEESLLSFTTKQ